MPYPDLNTLFTHGMGSMAAGYSGQMAQDQQAQDAANLQSTQLQNQQTQVMNPLNAQFRQGQINEQQAQLPGLQGIAQSQVAKGSLDTSTLASDIETKLSGNMSKIGADKVTQMNQDAQRALEAAQIMKNYPPSMHKQILTQFAQQYGGSAQSAMVAPFLTLPDDKVMDALTATATGMVKASASYITKMDEEDKKAASARELGLLHANAQVTVEDRRAASNERIGTGHDTAKLASAQARIDAMMHHMKPEDRFTTLNAIPDEELTSAQKIEKNRLVQFVMNAKAAGANQTASQILAGSNVDTPAQRAVNTADAVAPTNPKPVAPPSLIPAGMKQVGTSGGKPVYEDAKGNRFIGK